MTTHGKSRPEAGHRTLPSTAATITPDPRVRPGHAAASSPKSDPAPKATPRDWAGLGVLSLALLLISVDATVLDLAVPSITEQLTPTTPQLLWIIDVYSFVLAGLLVTMGTLGDRIGRRRLLMIGATGFAGASVAAAWAVDPGMLIAARVLQGVAGATLMPATLGLIRSMFADARQRTVAISVWGAMASSGAAFGPLLGGWMLEHFWWGSVFLVNLPVMALLVVLAPMLVPESRDPAPGRFDLVSAALSMLALIPIVYAVKEFAAHGPGLNPLVALVAGVVSGMLFLRRQRVLPAPLIDLDLFTLPAFRAAVVTNLLAVFALAGVLFFGSQYLQLVLGKSPLAAGLLLIPGTVGSMAGALSAAWWVARWRPATVLAGALVTVAAGAGTYWFLPTGPSGSAAPFIAGFLLIGLGEGVALTVSADMIVGSAPEARAGNAAAISETAMELGVALGVAVLGSAVMAVFRSGLDLSHVPSGGVATARESLGGAVEIAHALPEPAASALLHSARTAFVGGIDLAVTSMAAILLVTAVVAYRAATGRRGRRRERL